MASGMKCREMRGHSMRYSESAARLSIRQGTTTQEYLMSVTRLTIGGFYHSFRSKSTPLALARRRVNASSTLVTPCIQGKLRTLQTTRSSKLIMKTMRLSLLARMVRREEEKWAISL